MLHGVYTSTWIYRRIAWVHQEVLPTASSYAYHKITRTGVLGPIHQKPYQIPPVKTIPAS